MRKVYSKPMAEKVLFDINDVNMEITLLSEQNNGEAHLLDNLGTGLLIEE